MESGQGKVLPFDRWVGGFDKALVNYELRYTTKDRENTTMGAFAGFAHDMLPNPDFEDHIRVMHEAHPDITFPVAFNLLLRAFQHDRMAHDESYPIGYEDKQAWKEGYEGLVGDGIRDGVLDTDLRQHLLSNKADRYKVVPLFYNLMKERFGDNPSVLDIGCSQLHGGKKLVFRELLGPKHGPFNPLELVINTRNGLKVEKTISKAANLAIHETVSYGPSVGLDIRHADDVVTKQFAKACSFYPDELRYPAKVAEYELLESLDITHETVPFFNIDFSSNADVNQFRKETPLKSYDIIIFSTVLYQVTDEERTNMIVNAVNMLSDHGIIIIQDAPDKDHTKKYKYITNIIDGYNVEKGEQPLLKWATGRCLRAIPLSGKIAFKGTKLQTLPEILASM